MQTVATRGRDDPAAALGAPSRLAGVAVLVAVSVAVALRFAATSDLWLDEALSVNIARLPLGEIPDALRHDGHPPLYYLLLHGWIHVFGGGDVAVRALSGVLSVAALPVLWVAARRYAGPAAGLATVLLFAWSPFAVRYGTEARMYALVMLLVAAGWLAVRSAWDEPRGWRLAAVAVIAGLLLLTHYWAFYLVGALGLVLLWAWRRGERPQAARRLAAALGLGGLLFVPWVPGLLDQVSSTGTPWGRPERPTTVVMVSLTDFGGVPPSAEGQLLGIGTALLALLALLGAAVDRRRIELDLRTRARARPEAAVVALTVGLGVAAGYATGSAFASRYMAVVLPLLLLLAGLGVTRFASPRLRWAVVAALIALGAVGVGRNVTFDRTQGGEVAAYLDSAAVAGDVVGLCPDQLGPAALRTLDAPARAVAYAGSGPADRVDWVDYAERTDAASPGEFAAGLVDAAGPAGTVWLVWHGGYRTHDDACEDVAQALATARPGVTIRVEAGGAFEPMWLYEYPPVP